MMRQAVPGLFETMAPAPPAVQAPPPVPGLLDAAINSPSATVATAGRNLQAYLADPLQVMTRATLTGTAGRGLHGLAEASDPRGDNSDNSGLAGVASQATSLGGFLADALGNIATIANPTPIGLASIGYGISRNAPTFGVKGLFDAIAESMGFGGGWDQGGIGGYGTNGRGAQDPGVAGVPGGVTGRGSDGGARGADPTGGTGNTGGPGHSDGKW